MDQPILGHASAKTVAPAKINLFLGVSQGLDERGYHHVISVMCPLFLSDDVVVNVTGDDGIKLACDPGLPVVPEDNLAYRAASRLADRLGIVPHLLIELRKQVPSQAGLGGGSSDAAAVLRCLRSLWSVDDDGLVTGVAKGLGADVPFFLQSRPALLDGYGDELREAFDPLDLAVLLVKPACGVSTPAAYRAFDRLGTACPDSEDVVDALRSHDEARVLASIENNLTSASREVEPRVGGALDWLARVNGAISRPLLCGSGAACALFMANDDAARDAARRARDQGFWACATRTRTDGWSVPELP